VVGLALAALLILLRSKWTGLIARSPVQSGPRRIPGATRASSRSSALLAEQGEQAWQQGNNQRAYELFSRAIELDPANAAAWLGKGLVAEQGTEKRICFQRVLALDPGNETAQAELQKIEM
jgi:tetratricopeptide (TPR) repeat protein